MLSLEGQHANGWTNGLYTSSGKYFPLLIQHKNGLAAVSVWAMREQNTPDLPHVNTWPLGPTLNILKYPGYNRDKAKYR